MQAAGHVKLRCSAFAATLLWGMSCAHDPQRGGDEPLEFFPVGTDSDWAVAVFTSPVGLYAVKTDGSMWAWMLDASGSGLTEYQRTQGSDWIDVVGSDSSWLGCLAQDGSLWTVRSSYTDGCTAKVEDGPWSRAAETDQPITDSRELWRSGATSATRIVGPWRRWVLTPIGAMSRVRTTRTRQSPPSAPSSRTTACGVGGVTSRARWAMQPTSVGPRRSGLEGRPNGWTLPLGDSTPAPSSAMAPCGAGVPTKAEVSETVQVRTGDPPAGLERNPIGLGCSTLDRPA